MPGSLTRLCRGLRHVPWPHPTLQDPRRRVARSCASRLPRPRAGLWGCGRRMPGSWCLSLKPCGRFVVWRRRRRPPARALCVRSICGVRSLSLSLSCKFHCDVMCKIYTVPTRRCTPQHPARQEARAGRLAYSPANTEYSPCLGQEARTPGVWCLVNAEICRDHAEQRQQQQMRSQAV